MKKHANNKQTSEAQPLICTPLYPDLPQVIPPATPPVTARAELESAAPLTSRQPLGLTLAEVESLWGVGIEDEDGGLELGRGLTPVTFCNGDEDLDVFAKGRALFGGVVSCERR